MSTLVTIVVSAGGASERMLRACLCSLERHRGATEYKILVVAPWHQCGVPQKVSEDLGVQFHGVNARVDNLSGSRIHAATLDNCLYKVRTPYLLTLDADCFPVVDDWLDVMMSDIEAGAKVTGILHPWCPPPEELKSQTMEWRIRSQLCSNNTHVACQLVGLDTLKRLGVGFGDGDDTGLAIPVQARNAGMKVTGLKLSGCAYSTEADGLEFNREHCLIFGDKVYHHGGGCREEQGKGSPSDIWRLVRKRVLDEGGAEFILEDPYRYEFNNEEEVAAAMIEKILGGMQIYLLNHDRVFEE